MTDSRTEVEEQQAPELEELGHTCHDINSSLAAIVTSLEYLASQCGEEMNAAVSAAFAASSCIAATVARLRRRCVQLSPRAA